MVHQACLIFDLCFADLLCSEIRKGSSIVTHKVAGQAKTKVTNKLTLYKTCKNKYARSQNRLSEQLRDCSTHQQASPSPITEDKRFVCRDLVATESLIHLPPLA